MSRCVVAPHRLDDDLECVRSPVQDHSQLVQKLRLLNERRLINLSRDFLESQKFQLHVEDLGVAAEKSTWLRRDRDAVMSCVAAQREDG